MHDQEFLSLAIEEARKGFYEGGIPIGAVLVDRSGEIVSRGHNLRVQTGDPTAHAEIVCIRNAGRRQDWSDLTLVSTLSPCIMCTGTILLFHISKIVVGDSRTFTGPQDLFHQYGVNLVVLNNQICIHMMSQFIMAHPDLWNEDIGVNSESLCGGTRIDKPVGRRMESGRLRWP